MKIHVSTKTLQAMKQLETEVPKVISTKKL